MGVLAAVNVRGIEMFIWTIQDVLLVTVIVIAIIIYAFETCANWFKTSLCKHTYGVTEDRTCNAYCVKCGKNLGFIGNHKRD